jgi:hypothetical protein
MKVGSLVELVDDKWEDPFDGTITPVKNRIYTVRGLEGIDAIYLEEIINKIEPLLDESNNIINGEVAFFIHRFRELQPPIANIEEHINENTLTPELI